MPIFTDKINMRMESKAGENTPLAATLIEIRKLYDELLKSAGSIEHNPIRSKLSSHIAWLRQFADPEDKLDLG